MACFMGQEDVTGRSSLVVSRKAFREHLNVHRRLRRAARMVDEEEIRTDRNLRFKEKDATGIRRSECRN